VNDLRFAGEEQFHRTLEARDVERFVREIEYEDVVQRKTRRALPDPIDLRDSARRVENRFNEVEAI
jgi:hypothetical protein